MVITYIIIMTRYIKFVNINEINYFKIFDDSGDFNDHLLRCTSVVFLPFLNQFYLLTIQKFLKFNNY